MKPSVAIIDYEMGNVGSVINALNFLGVENVLTRAPAEISSATHIILPGVGAFGDGMKKLKEFSLPATLRAEVLDKKKPCLGICLGMQLLAEVGEEGGEHSGLGWIGGRVRRFRIDEDKFRLPHIGWNDVEAKDGAVLFRGISPSIFYFVHSYFIEPADNSVISATCDYGENFSAAIAKGNIYGVQFHPEKSQRSGLGVLKNFVTI